MTYVFDWHSKAILMSSFMRSFHANYFINSTIDINLFYTLIQSIYFLLQKRSQSFFCSSMKIQLCSFVQQLSLLCNRVAVNGHSPLKVSLTKFPLDENKLNSYCLIIYYWLESSPLYIYIKISYNTQ
jgi:hypothetical protein